MTKCIDGVPGFFVGCSEDMQRMTGVTVVTCPAGATGGIDLRGSATSTRQVDSLRPDHLVNTVHAVCFAGGSAFGLDCAAGVMKALSEKDIGLNVGFRTVPIVPSAVIFDVALGDHLAFPTPDMAYQACGNIDEPFLSGSFGAGCGASVGKVYGIVQAMKGGQGTALLEGGDDLVVAALTVCNAYGDILDPDTGQIIAGARSTEFDDQFADAQKVLGQGFVPVSSFAKAPENTVLSVIVTNADLDKSGCCRVAKMAHAGLSRVIRPAHSVFDGDVAIVLSKGSITANENAVGVLASSALQQAVLDAILNADGMGVIPDAKTFPPNRKKQ